MKDFTSSIVESAILPGRLRDRSEIKRPMDEVLPVGKALKKRKRVVGGQGVVRLQPRKALGKRKSKAGAAVERRAIMKLVEIEETIMVKSLPSPRVETSCPGLGDLHPGLGPLTSQAPIEPTPQVLGPRTSQSPSSVTQATKKSVLGLESLHSPDTQARIPGSKTVYYGSMAELGAEIYSGGLNFVIKESSLGPDALLHGARELGLEAPIVLPEIPATNLQFFNSSGARDPSSDKVNDAPRVNAEPKFDRSTVDVGDPSELGMIEKAGSASGPEAGVIVPLAVQLHGINNPETRHIHGASESEMAVSKSEVTEREIRRLKVDSVAKGTYSNIEFEAVAVQNLITQVHNAIEPDVALVKTQPPGHVLDTTTRSLASLSDRLFVRGNGFSNDFLLHVGLEKYFNYSTGSRLSMSLHFPDGHTLKQPSNSTLEYVALQVCFAAQQKGVEESIGGWTVMPVMFSCGSFRIGGIGVIIPDVKLAFRVDFRGWPFLVEGASVVWGLDTQAGRHHGDISLGFSMGVESTGDERGGSCSFGGLLDRGERVFAETCGHIGKGEMSSNGIVPKRSQPQIWIREPSNKDVRFLVSGKDQKTMEAATTLATLNQQVECQDREFSLTSKGHEAHKGIDITGNLLFTETKVAKGPKDPMVLTGDDFYEEEAWVYDQACFLNKPAKVTMKSLSRSVMRAKYLTLDYALVEITEIEKIKSITREANKLRMAMLENAGDLELGDILEKHGCSTGLTSGKVTSRRVYACLKGNTVKGAYGIYRRVVTTEYCVESPDKFVFSRPGDNGAWAYSQNCAKAKVMACSLNSRMINFSLVSPLKQSIAAAARGARIKGLKVFDPEVWGGI